MPIYENEEITRNRIKEYKETGDDFFITYAQRYLEIGCNPDWFIAGNWVYNALVERLEARKKKDWERADQIRNLIENSGYSIEDLPNNECNIRKINK